MNVGELKALLGDDDSVLIYIPDSDNGLDLAEPTVIDRIEYERIDMVPAIVPFDALILTPKVWKDDLGEL